MNVLFKITTLLIFTSIEGQFTTVDFNVLNSTVHELKSAIAVSQLLLAQQAEFFKKLANVTQTSTPCTRSDALLDSPTFSSACPYPYQRVVEECFYLSKIPLKWEDAREHCLGMGGDLATPTNLYGLKAHLIEIKGPKAMWLGAEYSDTEKGWVWVNGIPVKEEEWANSRLRNKERRIKTCMTMRRDWHPVLTEFACARRQRFICQYFSR